MPPSRVATAWPGPATRRWRVLLGLLMAVVGVLALSPAPPGQLHLGWDKLNHALAFAALGFCAARGWRSPPGRRWAVLAALLAFGAMIEVAQRWVPNRSAEWGDLLADAVGIVLGALVATALLRGVPETTARRA